ncbi:MAG TPA: TlpA disulfide reductase family protein [Pirellulaceae bacterium]|nr:TlpA disulfide reductase family protein [Pirellulaceae bacterium]
MIRFLLPLALFCFLVSPVWAEDSDEESKKASQAAAEKLKADPNSVENIRTYVNGELRRIFTLASTDPDAAEKELGELKTFLETIKPDQENAKRLMQSALNSFTNFQREIDSARKLKELVGKDAASLELGKIDTWVNGTPLTDADLKGKVVFLDFWAVWCGPCIATFPHLKEWQEKYADKGLVMVGLTRYYNMEWDDAAGRTKRVNKQERTVSAEDEQKMLEKFAEHHELKHRFAVQGQESKLDDYYAVNGIPHVVVIDQEGKIRMIKVGSGDENAKALDGLLKELLEK